MFVSGVVEVLVRGEGAVAEEVLVVEALGAEEALVLVRRVEAFFFSGESERSKRLPDSGVAVALPTIGIAGKSAMDAWPSCEIP